MRQFIATTLTLLSFQIQAGPACPNIHRGPIDEYDLFHRASIIGEENRKTFSEYAKEKAIALSEVHKKFGATGTFQCGGLESTANIVRKNNLLVLSAHQFFNRGTCTKKNGGNFSSCYFETIREDGKRGTRYSIKQSTLKLGTSCPSPNNSDMGDEWAIVELEKPVEGVTPYTPVNVKDLGSNKDDYADILDIKTSTISARNSNLKGHKFETPTICEDSVRDLQLQNDPKSRSYIQLSGCSAGGGGSGSGVLVSGSGPSMGFIGVVTDTASAAMDNKPYGPENFTAGPLLEGKFYDTLMNM